MPQLPLVMTSCIACLSRPSLRSLHKESDEDASSAKPPKACVHGNILSSMQKPY